jgi:hypothetical protein
VSCRAGLLPLTKSSVGGCALALLSFAAQQAPAEGLPTATSLTSHPPAQPLRPSLCTVLLHHPQALPPQRWRWGLPTSSACWLPTRTCASRLSRPASSPARIRQAVVVTARCALECNTHTSLPALCSPGQRNVASPQRGSGPTPSLEQHSKCPHRSAALLLCCAAWLGLQGERVMHSRAGYPHLLSILATCVYLGVKVTDGPQFARQLSGMLTNIVGPPVSADRVRCAVAGRLGWRAPGRLREFVGVVGLQGCLA